MSFWAIAIVAAYSAVMAPTVATTPAENGASSKSAPVRATM